MELIVTGINEAYPALIDLMKEEGGYEESRNGPVLSLPYPVLLTSTQPADRVLLDPTRDANPFFHFIEALWMLAGRNDVALLSQFNSRIAEYSDDGKTLYGAYGYRWRRGFMVDQLNNIIDLLREDRTTRRAVLTMWQPFDLAHDSKDKPCNTHIYFRVYMDDLEMTICNRSNDLLWGMLGSNYVHFSILHEYVARSIGKFQGCMHQFTNNLHVYTNDQWQRCSRAEVEPCDARTMPLIMNSRRFLHDVEKVLRYLDNPVSGYDHRLEEELHLEENYPLMDAIYMAGIYKAHKNKDHLTAKRLLKLMYQPAWQLACEEWINRRS